MSKSDKPDKGKTEEKVKVQDEVTSSVKKYRHKWRLQKVKTSPNHPLHPNEDWHICSVPKCGLRAIDSQLDEKDKLPCPSK